MALVLITHDMGVVAETAHRVQVMYAGQMVEEAPTAALFAAPRHPYTAALLDALPERALGRQRLPTIPGVVPGIDDRPAGCLFDPRCRFADRALRGGAARRSPARRGRRGALPLSAWRVPARCQRLMEARDLRRHYRVGGGLFARKGLVRAVDGVSFTLRAGRDAGGRRRIRAAASRRWRAWPR